MKKIKGISQSQGLEILQQLLQGECITPLDALYRFGCMRLGARIFDLRQLGWNIETTMVAVRNARGESAIVARYSIPLMSRGGKR